VRILLEHARLALVAGMVTGAVSQRARRLIDSDQTAVLVTPRRLGRYCTKVPPRKAFLARQRGAPILMGMSRQSKALRRCPLRSTTPSAAGSLPGPHPGSL